MKSNHNKKDIILSKRKSERKQDLADIEKLERFNSIECI